MLGERLRRLREKTEYTQQQIANALHIDRSTYTYYETGRTTPDNFTLLALVNIFHTTLDSLFHPDGRAPEPPSGQSLYSLSKSEKQLLACYRAMPPEKQKELLQALTKRKKKR